MWSSQAVSRAFIVIIIIIITPHTAHHLQFICSLVLLRSRLVDAVFGYSKIDLFTIAGWLQPVRHISCSVTTVPHVMVLPHHHHSGN